MNLNRQYIITVGSQCSLHDFVVIPAVNWDDIQRDRFEYTIAKCVDIQIDDQQQKHGIFWRYGNYSGKAGITRKIFPGFIDPKDMKYVYESVKSQRRYVPYTNDLSHLKAYVKLKKIYLQDLSLCFPELDKNCVPIAVQNEIDKIFPSYHPLASHSLNSIIQKQL